MDLNVILDITNAYATLKIVEDAIKEGRLTSHDPNYLQQTLTQVSVERERLGKIIDPYRHPANHSWREN